MEKNKKGQELSINVIITAVIALIVLVLLVAIFTGRINIFQEGIEEYVLEEKNCTTKDICYMEGIMAGSNITISSMEGNESCVFPFNYNITLEDELYLNVYTIEVCE
jgi:hypothetical protein